MARDLITVEGLEKEFRIGFFMKRVQAVRGISFRVQEGDIFGFLGPNGAGKTTTIKMLTGLIRPSKGSATLMGLPVQTSEARKKIGFLPESPYIFPYLTPREFVEMSGSLSGLRGAALRDRAKQVLTQTGVWYAADRPAKRLSKGMLQRTALAASLVADPELLILDEPMSGLDPIGRKEVKDLIVEERAAGRTIFFSTHILGDVETLCDSVTILRKGEIVVQGKLDELLRRDVKRVSVVLRGTNSELVEQAQRAGAKVDAMGGRLRMELPSTTELTAILSAALASGLEVEEVVPRHETLEDLFVREAITNRAEPTG